MSHNTTTAAATALDLAVNTLHDVLVKAQQFAEAAQVEANMAAKRAQDAKDALAPLEDEYEALIAAQEALKGLGRDELTHGLSADDLELFLDYAKDSGNWGGMPLLGGNVGDDNPVSVAQLEAEGLITLAEDREPINGKKSLCYWVSFTEAGVALAAQHGRTIDAS